MAKTMTVAEARKKFGSYYHIARIVNRNLSTVLKWQRIPAEHIPTLLNHPGGRLQRGGRR